MVTKRYTLYSLSLQILIILHTRSYQPRFAIVIFTRIMIQHLIRTFCYFTVFGTYFYNFEIHFVSIKRIIMFYNFSCILISVLRLISKKNKIRLKDSFHDHYMITVRQILS